MKYPPAPQPIFCDEAGYTGPDLLNPDQPYFVYSAVAVTEEEAKQLVDEARHRYAYAAYELKSSALLRRARGRELTRHLLDQVSGRCHVAVFHKRYSLACKFFEYIFEPPLANNSSFFYALGFHKFLATGLCCSVEYDESHAARLFEEFATLARTMSTDNLPILFGSSELLGLPPWLQEIRDFARANRAFIQEELDTLQGTAIGKWLLDLSHEAVSSLLSRVGEQHGQLRVYYDHSAPIREVADHFDGLVGAQDHPYIEVQGQQIPVGFNLEQPLLASDSREQPGIQIADLVAGATTAVLKDPGDNFLREVVPTDPTPVLPDESVVNLAELGPQRNAFVLAQLGLRSRENVDLVAGLPELVAQLPHFAD